MGVDNFDIIRPFLNFEDADALYCVSVIMRRKDNPEMSKATKLVRTYHIRSLENFDKCIPSIRSECSAMQARAYIDTNAKSVKKVALLALRKAAELISENQNDAVRNAYELACGSAPCIGQKSWLVDIDVKDERVVSDTIERVKAVGGAIILTLPTVNGSHVLTSPFPLKKFNKADNVSVVKHGITLLYTCARPQHADITPT